MSTSPSLRGRVLENAIARAARAYQAAGRCALVKRATPMRKIAGEYRFGAKAGVDFDGMLPGGRRLVLEAKLTQKAILPLSDFPLHERQELHQVASFGGEALVVCAFEDLAETYAIAWAALYQQFFARQWRESISVDVFRGWGLLVPDAPRHDPASRSCLFLDGRPHRDAAAARARVEEEAARPRRARKVAEIDFSAPSRTAGLVRRTPEEARASILGAIAAHHSARRGRR